MKDYFENLRAKIAKNLIQEWKRNEAALLAEHGSREDYFLQAEAAELWKDARVRDEFQGEKKALLAFLENEHRVTDHKKGISRHNKEDYSPADDVADDAGIMAKWDADPALQNEFGDFDTFAAYQNNRHKVKVLNN